METQLHPLLRAVNTTCENKNQTYSKIKKHSSTWTIPKSLANGVEEGKGQNRTSDKKLDKTLDMDKPREAAKSQKTGKTYKMEELQTML
ncbi:hypothetical protein IFR05_008747 [Cadophora sp. M221]|nr:hypothetical protein IFR05_008747 [Cadophora sp. M221]